MLYNIRSYLKVKLSRYSPCRRPYSFLTSALDGVSGQRHAPAALYPRERTPGIHQRGGWVGLRAGLNTEARGKTLLPLPGLYPGRPVCSHTILTEPPQLVRDLFYFYAG
jgi:hypothetical protein